MREPDSYPAWMEKTALSQIAVLTLDDGERLTGELSDRDLDKDELMVAVISSNRAHVHGEQVRAIPIGRVVSYEPTARADQPWPFCDPCRSLRTTFSPARFALWLTLLLCLIAGALWLVLALAQVVPGQIQVLSALVYTIAATWFTFAEVSSRGGKSLSPYMFTCPAVRPQLIPLALRHLAFLVLLAVILTVALAVRPLPNWLERNDYFSLAMLLLSGSVFFTEVFTNRRLLDRAHATFYP